MKKLVFQSIVVGLLLISCSQEKAEITPLKVSLLETPNDPQGYWEWQQERLKDPATGEIPENIRAKELAFAAKLPRESSRLLNWTSRGPFNKGGRTRALAFDVQDENIMLAGGVTGGVWRTTDLGESWVKTTDPLQMHSVTSLAQDTRVGQESVWYCGTGEYYGIVSGTSFTSRYSGDGIFKSTDGGLSWTKLASTSSGTPQTIYELADMDFVWRIITDHTDLVNDVVLAAVYNGIYRSDDGGSSWTPVLGLDTTASASANVDLIKTPSGVFYASIGSGSPSKGFWRSEDGVNWTNISPVLPSNLGRIAMAYDPQNENVVWFFGQTNGVGTDGHSVWKYRYLSGDGSGTNGVWENKSSGMPNYACTGFFTFDFGAVNTQSSYNVCVAVHPADSNVIYLGGTNIYRTDDQFASSASSDWIGGYRCNQADLSDYVYPNHHPDNHFMLFQPSNDSILWTANDGGVYKTLNNLKDSVDWVVQNKGYVTTQFYTTAIEQGDVSTDYLIGGMQDNGTWFTNQVHPDSPWVEIGRGDGSYCAIPEGRDFYLVSIQQGKIQIQDMDNDGNVLSFKRIDPTGGPSNYNFINPFILDPNNSDIMYNNGRSRLWRQDSLSFIPQTNDIYNTISMGWTSMTSSYVGINSGYITCMDMCPVAENKIWYGTSGGKLFRLDSANQTGVQTDLTGVDFPSNSYMSSVAVNPLNEDEIMVTFSNYNIPSIFYSNDGGLTWEDIGGNLEQNPDGTGNGPAAYWAYLYPDGTKFVGTSVGLFSVNATNGASTVWNMEGPSEIGNVVINMIKARPFDGKIVVATHGNGIYEASLPPAFLDDPRITVNELAVYPNPTTDFINFELEIKMNAELKIFDLKGALVAKERLNQDASTHQIDVNALSSGTYIYSIQVGEDKLTGRFIKQ